MSSTASPRRVVALTQDASLARALEELAAMNLAVVQVHSTEALAEELLAGTPAIALIDSAALSRPLDQLVDQLAAQFPDQRLIVAGHGLEQSLLATRIAQGQVFRFVHKPASAQRLKLFVDAANRPTDAARAAQTQTLEVLREPVARINVATPPAGPEGPRGPKLKVPLPWIVGGAVALAAAVLGFVISGQGFGDTKPAAQAKADAAPAPATAATEALIRSADQAFAAQRFVARDGTSAAELYQRALVDAPQDIRARSGLTRSIDFALRNAETAFTESRFADAEGIIAALQIVAPGNSRLSFLSTQLRRERERTAAEENRRLSAESRQEKLRTTLQQAGERLRRGALLEPDRDNALDLYFNAADLAPNDSDVRAFRDRLSARLLEGATQKLDAGDVPAARGLLDAAASLGGDGSGVTRLRRRADELTSAAAAPAAPPAPRPASAEVAPPPASAATVTPVAAPAAAAPPPATTTTTTTATGGPATLRIYTRSELTLVREVEIEYPVRAAENSVAGWVDIEFTVATDGSVKNLIVLNAEPKGVFENNAMQALRRWRYKPVLENGTPVDARARLRLRFTPPPQR
jgi:TonB family protein